MLSSVLCLVRGPSSFDFKSSLGNLQYCKLQMGLVSEIFYKLFWQNFGDFKSITANKRLVASITEHCC